MAIRKTPKSLNRTKVKPVPKFKTIFLLATISIIAGGCGAAIAFLMNSKPFQQSLTSAEAETFNSDIAKGTLGLPELTRPVNILVMGTIVLSSDLPSAAYLPKPQYFAQVESNLDGQSDAILLVRIDPVAQKVVALSIPRDSRVEIPGYGVQKINAANYIGGAVLSAQTVSNLTGQIQIDRYIRLNVQGFGQLIDALGGVEVYVPKRMKYQDDSQRLYINLNQGKQILDGRKAVMYMRYRHDELGDIGRVQRQQAFIREVINQKLKLETISRIPDILAVVRENLDTNMSLQELLAVAMVMSKIDRQNTKMLMLPGRFSTSAEFPLSYWIVDEQRLARLMQEHFNVAYPDELWAVEDRTPETLRIVVQDTTYFPDKIKTATQKLVDAGYTLTFADNLLPTQILDTTAIIAQNGDRKSAESIQTVLGVGEVILEATGEIESDVTVRLGRDWIRKNRPRQQWPCAF